MACADIPVVPGGIALLYGSLTPSSLSRLRSAAVLSAVDKNLVPYGIEGKVLPPTEEETLPVQDGNQSLAAHGNYPFLVSPFP